MSPVFTAHHQVSEFHKLYCLTSNFNVSYLSLKNMILISNWCRKLIKLKQSGPLSEASLKIKGGVSEAAVSEAAGKQSVA